MISYADIQVQYNNLYREVRRYMWSFPAVQDLADLEIACYQTCPNLSAIRSAFIKFRQYASELMREDEDLKAQFDAFQDLIDSDNTTYAKLMQVKEVLS